MYRSLIFEKELTKLASIKTFAIAKYYALVENIDDLSSVIKFAKTNKLEITILGNGTNILFSKDYYDDRLFIKLGKGFKYFKLLDTHIEIGASYSLVLAGNKLLKEGYIDFIYMNLIPGTFGGAVRQNAGTTNEGEIKDNFFSAKLYDIENEKVVEFNLTQMLFDYRDSIIQKENGKYILLSAQMLLGKKSDNIETSKKLVKEKIRTKKAKEPQGKSFGSTFKGLRDGTPAWKVIDQCNLKGINYGDAFVSNKHANWIINSSNATGQDVFKLVNIVKAEVEAQLAVKLVEEVEII